MKQHDDDDVITCEQCGSPMQESGRGSATQDNGCDVDWVTHQCTACGHISTDI